MMKLTIGHRFGAALFVATLSPILYFGYHDFAAEKERLVGGTLREMFVNCISRAQSMERMFINAHADLNYLRTSMPLRFLMDVPADKPDGAIYWQSLVEQEFHHFLSLNSDYAEIGLIDVEGNEKVILFRSGERLISRETEGLRNRSTAPHFIATTGMERYGIAAIPITVAVDQRRPLQDVTLLRYAAKVFDRQGALRFVLYIDMNGAHAAYSLQHKSFEMRRDAALLTGEGRYLYDPFSTEASVENQNKGGGDIHDQFSRVVVSQILSGRPGIITDDPDDLYAYVPVLPQVGDGDLYYVIFDRYSRSQFAPALAPLRQRYLFGVGVALGICLVLAVLVSRRLTRNLNQLREGVTLMAQRNLSHRIDIHSGDEIAQLADAYNTMAASLQEYHHSLEEKVAERTATIRKVENRLTQTEKLASIGFLAAGVAHEVNNPITIILTRLELIRKQRGESTSPLLVKDLDTIARHASRIGEIAGGLLTFARTGSKQIGPLDVNKVTGRMCELMAHPIQKKGITFTCRKSDEPLMALGSETGFEQTFYNLLYNAYQSTPAGETITVTTKEGEDAVVVMVADTGPGVAAAHLGKIFDPFFTTKEPGEGTGLGLSVSYGMIHDMGGGLTVESEEGEGATFTIRLRPVKAETGEPQNLPVRMIG